MKIGNNLEKFRTNMHLTQKSVANAIHVSRQTISNWEREISYPSLESLINLSCLYHVSIDQLLDNKSFY